MMKTEQQHISPEVQREFDKNVAVARLLESKQVSPVVKAASEYSAKIGFSGSLPKAFIAGAKWKAGWDRLKKSSKK